MRTHGLQSKPSGLQQNGECSFRLEILVFFPFCSPFWLSWIRIRIPNTDPDPESHFNTDLHGSGSQTLSKVSITLVHFKIFHENSWKMIKSAKTFVRQKKRVVDLDLHLQYTQKDTILFCYWPYWRICIKNRPYSHKKLHHP